VYSQLVVSKIRKRRYMLSPQLSQALSLKKRQRLQIRYDAAEETIHLGPTIGILASYIPNNTECDPRSTQAELVYLSKLSQNITGQIYIFTLNSINWSNLTTRGYTYKQITEDKGVWLASTYPLPDVVYDRVGSRVKEATQSHKNARKKLMNLPHIKYFNPSFLNKWRVHQLLSSEERLHPYLPETQTLNLPNLKYMLEKYKVLYLKPQNGSLGSGIIKVHQDGQGNIRFMAYKQGRHPGRADGAPGLLRSTRQIRDGKPYIVQQGLDLAEYQGAAFDIRIIYQKNGQGEWTISKKFVRVAAKGSSVANLARGGRAELSKNVLRSVYKRNKSVIEKRNEEIKELCRLVAQTLEHTSRKTYGELGLDIGIDKNGNPWLIEVNSKPRKTTETDTSKCIMRNTFKRPLEYAVYLAGFKANAKNAD